MLANLEARSSAEPPKAYTAMCTVLVAVNPLRRVPGGPDSATYKAAPQVHRNPRAPAPAS